MFVNSVSKGTYSKLILCSMIISPLPNKYPINFYKYYGENGERVGTLINCSPYNFSSEHDLDDFEKEIAVNISFNFNYVHNDTYIKRYFYVNESNVKIYTEQDKLYIIKSNYDSL